MLKGMIVYKSDSGGVFKYNVEGMDTSSYFQGVISSASYDAIDLMAGESNDLNLESRRFDVGMSTVKVQTNRYQIVDENGKTKSKPAPVNYDFFCRLGAILRYAKMQCKRSNELGYTGLVSASGEADFESQNDYEFELGEGTGYRGKVSLRLSEIVSVSLKSKYFDIELAWDSCSEIPLLPAIKNSTPKAFRFNQDTLGFAPLSAVDKGHLHNTNGLHKSLVDVIEAHPDKEFDWLLSKDYRIVDDQSLESVCEYIMGYDDYVYYDTETTGLNINFKSRIGQADELVGVVLSVKDGESFYFPCQMKNIPNLCGGDHWFFMEKYMKPILESKKLVCHNMSYDWKVSYIYGINANIVHDTMALIKLTIGAEKSNFPMSLKELAKILLHRDSIELSDLVLMDDWGDSGFKFWDLPEELVRLYACADTDNTRGILQYAMQNDLLHKYNAKRVYEIEIAFSYAVAYQEFFGHKINVEEVADVTRIIEAENVKLLKQMIDMVGHEFNPSSPTQLTTVMYKELGIPEQISRKTGRVTTDKDALEYLESITDIDGNQKYPFVGVLLKYRTNMGVLKTVKKFPELATSDGYLFSSVHQYGTTTGRVSVSDPNYQSYNDAVKKRIVPRPGFYMTDTDYSSVEYRVLGSMSGNKMIMKGFEDPDFDYHTYQASHMYSVPYASVTKRLRKTAKSINFGIPYGMGDASLGFSVFGEETPENTAKAANLRKKYFEGQEDVRDFFETARDKGCNLGYTETYFGRRRYYNPTKFSRNAIRRQAGNQVVQGSAADIYKLAAGRVFKRICREGWLGKVLLTGFIHDELLAEVSVDINPAHWLKVLREEFEVAIEGWCPIYMGFGYGTSWYEAKSVELPIKFQWEFVEKYGAEGYPDWDGNGRAFCDKVPTMLHDFDVRDIRSQLLDKEHQGEVIKLALNSAILARTKSDIKFYNKTVDEYFSDKGKEALPVDTQKEELLKLLASEYIDSIPTKDGGIITQLEVPTETQPAIDVFCMLHSVDRTQVDLKDIPDATEGTSTGNDVVVSSGLMEQNDEEVISQRMIDARIDNFGLYLDTDSKMILLKIVPPQFMSFIKSHSNSSKGYRIRFKDSANQMWYDTQSYIASEEVSTIQAMYLEYFKALSAMGGQAQ